MDEMNKYFDDVQRDLEKENICQKYAKEIIDNNNIIYDELYDEFYYYDEGYYKVLSNQYLRRLIVDHEEGYKFSNTGINNTVSFVKTFGFVDPSLINPRHYLNLQNCMYDIFNFKSMDHDKDIISTIRLPYIFSESRKCELWVKTLNEIFDNDQAKIQTIQEFFGYCLSPNNSMKKALILYGESNTGKSVILHILESLVGKDNVSNVALNQFNDPGALCLLYNKFLNVDSEIPKRSKEYESTFKRITSGERIQANQKYKARFDFEPFCKLIFAANELPYIDDKSSAIYNRLLIVPFVRTFEGDKDDKELKHKIVTHELSGVFNWAIEGLRNLLKRMRFDTYSYMEKQIEEIKTSNNPLIDFIEYNCIVTGEDFDTIVKSDLYAMYRQWAEDFGYKPLSYRNFNNDVKRFFGKKNVNEDRPRIEGEKTRIWTGMKVG